MDTGEGAIDTVQSGQSTNSNGMFFGSHNSVHVMSCDISETTPTICTGTKYMALMGNVTADGHVPVWVSGLEWCTGPPRDHVTHT